MTKWESREESISAYRDHTILNLAWRRTISIIESESWRIDRETTQEPYPEINGLPVWIVAGVERPPILVELVGEHKLILMPIETCSRKLILRCLGVYELSNRR